MSDTAPARSKRSVFQVLQQLRQPKVAVMLALGFTSGLPFLLTANTFGYWLRDAGTSLLAIGSSPGLDSLMHSRFIGRP